MKLANECFNKVKKNCFKFIKSQETKTDKFKNKERMIKSFLIPLCFWINKKADKKVISISIKTNTEAETNTSDIIL